MEKMILSLFELSLGASIVIVLMQLVAPLAGKKLSAKWRYWIWIALALRLLLPFDLELAAPAMTVEIPESFVSQEIILPESEIQMEIVPAVPEESDEDDIILEVETIAPVINEETKTLWNPSPLQLVGIVWILGAVGTLIYQSFSYYRYLAKLRPWKQSVEDKELLNLYEELCIDLGLTNIPQLFRNRSIQSPMLIGILKPAIILPEMTYGEDDYIVILSHELNHYKRHDLWYKIVVLAALCVHWFNPMVWLMVREANNDLEISCDEAVVKTSSNDDRAQYCEAILRIMCRGKGSYTMLSTGVNGGKKVLQRRFTAVLNDKPGKGIFMGAIALCMVFLSGTFVGCQVAERSEANAEIPVASVEDEKPKDEATEENEQGEAEPKDDHSFDIYYKEKEVNVEDEIVKAVFYAMLRDLEEIRDPKYDTNAADSFTVVWDNNSESISYQLYADKENNRTLVKSEDEWYETDANYYDSLVFYVTEPETENQQPAAQPQTSITVEQGSLKSREPFKQNFNGLDVHSSEYYQTINYYTVDEKVINTIISGLDWNSMTKTASVQGMTTDDPDKTGPYIRLVTNEMEQIYLFKNRPVAIYRDFDGNSTYYSMSGNTYNEMIALLEEVKNWKQNPMTSERAEPFDENYDYLDFYIAERGQSFSITVRTFCEMFVEDLNWINCAEKDSNMETPDPIGISDGYFLRISTDNGRHLYIYQNNVAVYYTGHGREICYKLTNGSYQRMMNLLYKYQKYQNLNYTVDEFPFQKEFSLVSVSADGGKAYKLDSEQSFRMMAGVPTGYFGRPVKGISFDVNEERHILIENEDGCSLAFVSGRSQAVYRDAKGKESYYELGGDYYDIAYIVANGLVEEEYGESIRFSPDTGYDTGTSAKAEITLKHKEKQIKLSNQSDIQELYGYLQKMRQTDKTINPTAGYSEPVTIVISSSDINGSYVYDPDNMGLALVELGSQKQYWVDSCINDVISKYFTVANNVNPDTAKPVIYLYPERSTDVSIQLDYNGLLTTTYPAYKDGWNVTAKPDGTISDGKREYYCLFWEGISAVPYDLSSGFVVKGNETEAFLERSLAELGLNDKEANEFIIYWLPKMENNPYNLISFQEEQYTDNARLTVSPQPDSILRVFMAWKGLEQPVTVPSQELKPFVRQGFTLVEWGGSEIW